MTFGRQKKHRTELITTALCIALLAALLIGAALFVFPDLFDSRPKDEPRYKQGESLISDMLRDGDEIRGVYVATVSNLNYPSSRDLSAAELISELDAIIDTCLDAGLNTVVFQARPACDAFYDS